uniref:DUF5302 domain-containing protein n=1 Tax=Rhabditophanes sp. KR3021 TaxID=114890 RepID=A0AC35TX17_9BILA
MTKSTNVSDPSELLARAIANDKKKKEKATQEARVAEAAAKQERIKAAQDAKVAVKLGKRKAGKPFVK